MAEGYERYFVPRFRPWVDEAIAALEPSIDGALVVTCAGPGAEVERIARMWPRRHILAIDLSERMVERMRARCAALDNVEAICADATELPASGYAGLLSCFGLQQMPDPVETISNWTAAVAKGGMLSVMFWPADTEPHGPFGLCRRIAAQRIDLPERDDEHHLVRAIHAAGGIVSSDRRVSHSIEHASARSMWEAMTRSGPWRALELRHGRELLDEIGRAFVEQCADGPLRQRPTARHLVVHR